MSHPSLARRVADAAEIALANRKYVTFIDVVTGLRWVHSRHVDIWRQGRASHLAELAAVDEDRLATAADLLQRWAEAKGLRPVETPYLGGTRDRRELRFTATADDPSNAPAVPTGSLPASSRGGQGARPRGGGPARRLDLRDLPGHRPLPDHGRRRPTLPDLRGHGPPGLPAGG